MFDKGLKQSSTLSCDSSYWYMYISQVLGEHLQDHWSSGLQSNFYLKLVT